MIIKEIIYRQLIQIRNFEPCDISVTAILNEGDQPEQVVAELKSFVQAELKKAYYIANPDKKPKEGVVNPNIGEVKAVLNTTEKQPGTKIPPATPVQNSTGEEIPNL